MYPEKHTEVFSAFMDPEKACGRVDRKGLWDVLRIHGVRGNLLEDRLFLQRQKYLCSCVCGAE